MNLRQNTVLSVLAILPICTVSCASESDSSKVAVGGTSSVVGGASGTAIGGNVGLGGSSVVHASIESGSSSVSSTSATVGGASATGTASSSVIVAGGATSKGTGTIKGGTDAMDGTKTTGGNATTGGTPMTGGTTSIGSSKATGGATTSGGTATGGTLSSNGGGSSCPLPTTYKWTDSFDGAIVNPGDPNWSGLKDFTNVVYNGKHIIYMTTYDKGLKYRSAGIAPFTDWNAAATATQTAMATAAVAPELIYFSPKDTWILSYQWCSAKFCYMTSSDPSNAKSWTGAMPLLTEDIVNSNMGPIDPVVICDTKNCYLFYAGGNGNVYRASMPIGDFPGTFSSSKSILQDQDREANLLGSVEVYTIKGTGTYLMLVEAEGTGGNYFRAFKATRLDGNWTAISNAATESSPFAGKSNVTFIKMWTKDISHGDLVRSHDETRTVDACNLQMIYQGYNGSSMVTSDIRPYRAGLLTLVK